MGIQLAIRSRLAILLGMVLPFVAGVGLLGCAGTAGSGSSASPVRTYMAPLEEVLPAIERTLVRLEYRIENVTEEPTRVSLVAFRSGGVRQGVQSNNPRVREAIITLRVLREDMTRVELRLPPASAYQVQPDRHDVEEFFRIFEGLGFEPAD